MELASWDPTSVVRSFEEVDDGLKWFVFGMLGLSFHYGGWHAENKDRGRLERMTKNPEYKRIDARLIRLVADAQANPAFGGPGAEAEQEAEAAGPFGAVFGVRLLAAPFKQVQEKVKRIFSGDDEEHRKQEQVKLFGNNAANLLFIFLRNKEKLAYFQMLLCACLCVVYFFSGFAEELLDIFRAVKTEHGALLLLFVLSPLAVALLTIFSIG